MSAPKFRTSAISGISDECPLLAESGRCLEGLTLLPKFKCRRKQWHFQWHCLINLKLLYPIFLPPLNLIPLISM